MNPCHCAPCLEFDDGSAMWESNAIMRYLVVNYDKENKLYPEDAKLRGRIDMCMDWRQARYVSKITVPDAVYLLFASFSPIALIHQCFTLNYKKTTVSTPAFPTLATSSSEWNAPTKEPSNHSINS
jgi:glutaredoxin 2